MTAIEQHTSNPLKAQQQQQQQKMEWEKVRGKKEETAEAYYAKRLVDTKLKMTAQTQLPTIRLMSPTQTTQGCCCCCCWRNRSFFKLVISRKDELDVGRVLATTAAIAHLEWSLWEGKAGPDISCTCLMFCTLRMYSTTKINNCVQFYFIILLLLHGSNSTCTVLVQ